jgi:hypothetical protein
MVFMSQTGRLVGKCKVIQRISASVLIKIVLGAEERAAFIQGRRETGSQRVVTGG